MTSDRISAPGEKPPLGAEGQRRLFSQYETASCVPTRSRPKTIRTTKGAPERLMRRYQAVNSKICRADGSPIDANTLPCKILPTFARAGTARREDPAKGAQDHARAVADDIVPLRYGCSRGAEVRHTLR
jgi:hypothetical protein